MEHYECLRVKSRGDPPKEIDLIELYGMLAKAVPLESSAFESHLTSAAGNIIFDQTFNFGVPNDVPTDIGR